MCDVLFTGCRRRESFLLRAATVQLHLDAPVDRQVPADRRRDESSWRHVRGDRRL